MKIRFAVLGAGRIGKVHASAISNVSAAELVAISDPIESAAQSMRTLYGCNIRTIEAIESDANIDAVVICTPTDTHADLIERFCRAGKAVFCEKPVDLDLARAQAVLKTIAAVDGKLMVGFQRRFDPDFMALKKAIDDGKIGKVEMVTLTSRDPDLPPYDYISRSGGIFRDMTIHDFDMARWLLGEEIETVQASASVLVDPEIGKLGDFDSVNIILTTANGLQCTITNSRRATYGYDQRIEVHGSAGSVSVKNHLENGVQIANESGFVAAPLMDFFMTRYAQAYTNEITAFVAALDQGSPMPTTGHDGLMALALAEAAGQSAKTGRAVSVRKLIENLGQ
ncbi:MAG: inositol 2-dehydrogenase [Paracoccaceae bacterium]